jgi:hypothetical protein
LAGVGVSLCLIDGQILLILSLIIHGHQFFHLVVDMRKSWLHVDIKTLALGFLLRPKAVSKMATAIDHGIHVGVDVLAQ